MSLPIPSTIRDDLIRYLDAHGATCPDGKACQEQFNVIAFLAHCVGLRATVDTLDQLGAMMKFYEERCPDCAHKRN